MPVKIKDIEGALVEQLDTKTDFGKGYMRIRMEMGEKQIGLKKGNLITIMENELSKMQKEFRECNSGHFHLSEFKLFCNIANAIIAKEKELFECVKEGK